MDLFNVIAHLTTLELFNVVVGLASIFGVIVSIAGICLSVRSLRQSIKSSEESAKQAKDYYIKAKQQGDVFDFDVECAGLLSNNHLNLSIKMNNYCKEPIVVEKIYLASFNFSHSIKSAIFRDLKGIGFYENMDICCPDIHQESKFGMSKFDIAIIKHDMLYVNIDIDLKETLEDDNDIEAFKKKIYTDKPTEFFLILIAHHTIKVKSFNIITATDYIQKFTNIKNNIKNSIV